MADNTRLTWQVKTSAGAKSGLFGVNSRSGVVRVKTELAAGTLQSVTASMPWRMEAGERVFMNGYQTWTYSPELSAKGKLRGVSGLPKPLLNKYFFDRYGDYHFVRYGKNAGQSHGFSYCYFRQGETYRLVASLDETAGYTIIRYDANAGTLSFERDCAGVEHAGGEFAAFELFFAEGGEDEVFDAWFAAMGCRARTREKLAGYSSWYNRYQNITENAILEDLDGCKTLMRAGDLFQIDDGWEPKVGDWLTVDAEKFPHGLRPLADAAHEAGFKAGLWLAPFVCETDSAIYKEHPDWLLKADGKPWCCGCNWSGFYSLDIDVPAVQEYLQKTFRLVLDEWDFDLVKLDFLYGAAPFGTAHESRAARMQRAMRMLRQWCGDKLILGCGVPVMPAFGVVDYCRVSCDVGLDWDDKPYMRLFHRERVSTKQAINNTLLRRQLNGRAYGSDPDVFFLREENCKLTAQQKQTLAEANALLGSVLLTSDMPSRYSPEAKEQYAALRRLAANACNVHVRDGTNGSYSISYEMDGERKEIEVKL